MPLRDCDRPAHCDCRYRHYEDRRSKQRRSDIAPEHIPPSDGKGERRHGSGRRTEDRGDATADSPSLLDDAYYDYVLKNRA